MLFLAMMIVNSSIIEIQFRGISAMNVVITLATMATVTQMTTTTTTIIIIVMTIMTIMTMTVGTDAVRASFPAIALTFFVSALFDGLHGWKCSGFQRRLIFDRLLRLNRILQCTKIVNFLLNSLNNVRIRIIIVIVAAATVIVIIIIIVVIRIISISISISIICASQRIILHSIALFSASFANSIMMIADCIYTAIVVAVAVAAVMMVMVIHGMLSGTTSTTTHTFTARNFTNDVIVHV
jgi:hypothetical protein